MNLIRSKVTILFAISLSVAVAFGFLTITSFYKYNEVQKLIDESYTVVDYSIMLQNKKLTKEQIDDLTAIAPKLAPDFRSLALKDVLKSPSVDNINFLVRAENEFRKYNTSMIAYLKKQVTYFGLISLVTTLFLVIGLSYFVFKTILRPIDDLTSKMTDFVDEKYSYEFSVPEENEIGTLHSTFNLMAQKVLTQIDELKSLDKAKTEFLSIASHELRTPLTSIKGSLSLLNSGVVGKLNETSANLLNIALNETDRLIRLINELLDMAKIEARQFPLSLKWVQGESLISKTFASLHGFCQSADVKLVAGDCKDIELEIDEDRMQQVLTNLLSNAIKYSPKGEKVSVQFIIDEQNHMRVEVSDRGKGIAPEDQNIIFEKFRQASSTNNPLVKGTGLGLAIAKSLVEQHGGEIGVRSNPGEGSTFYFVLPKWRHHSIDKQGSAA